MSTKDMYKNVYKILLIIAHVSNKREMEENLTHTIELKGTNY